MKIGRTSCKKTQHPILDNCDFQTNRTLKRVKRRGLTSHPLTAVPALTHSLGLWETSPSSPLCLQGPRSHSQHPCSTHRPGETQREGSQETSHHPPRGVQLQEINTLGLGQELSNNSEIIYTQTHAGESKCEKIYNLQKKVKSIYS